VPGCLLRRIHGIHVPLVSHSPDPAFSRLSPVDRWFCCYAPSTTTNKPVEVSVGRWLDAALHEPWKLVCRHPTPVHRGHGRGLRQSRGYRPEHRKSGESPHSQARKRIGLRDNCWRDGLTCLRISTPNYWLWRHETPDANVPVAERRKTRNSAVESRTCLPAYDSSHAAWNIVIGKQGYHMAACASGRVKPPGDDAQYTTYLQYGRRYTSDDDHHN
jgi:hypothetical protein